MSLHDNLEQTAARARRAVASLVEEVLGRPGDLTSSLLDCRKFLVITGSRSVQGTLHVLAVCCDFVGMLSHASIAACEYGMSCVVNLADATRLIRTGQRLRVDGDRGLVEVIED
jgi:hypothetical protein